MKINLKEVVNGWGNYYLDKLNMLSDEKKAEAQNKLQFCNNCKLNRNGYCSTKERARIAFGDSKFTVVAGCGCPIQKKVLSDSDCPRWYFNESGIVGTGSYLDDEDNMQFLAEG